MNRIMRVLYVLNTTAMGGGNISLINMLKGLYDKGVEIYIVYAGRKMDSVFYNETKDIVYGYYHNWMHSYWHPRIKMRKTVKQKIKSIIVRIFCLSEDIGLQRIVKKVKPDIIHTNVGVMHTGFKVAKKNGIPHIWHLREYQTKDFDFVIEPSYDEFVAMLHQSYIIAITKDILSYFKLDDYDKARCVYNGCFTRKDTYFDYPKEKYFLCCSQIVRSKGHKDVINAFAKFYAVHKDYKLVIAGFGEKDYIDELNDILKKEDIESVVEFVGYKEDVKPLMRKARALIVASLCEGFGRMTAEASFCGCLVIGRNSGGTKEILENTGGFLYGEGRSELLEAMNQVADLSDDEYRNIVARAQAIAIDTYSIEQNVDMVSEFYREILAT